MWSSFFKGGFYVIRSEVSFTPGRVLAVEKPSRAILPYAYGSESSNTIKVLQYVANRFGPVASFTGTYRATSWRLNIHRRSADLGMSIASIVRETTCNYVFGLSVLSKTRPCKVDSPIVHRLCVSDSSSHCLHSSIHLYRGTSKLHRTIVTTR